MNSEYNHIFLANIAQSERFTSTINGRGGANIPNRDRASHATLLKTKFDAIWQEVESNKEQREAVSLSTREGTYLEFTSAANHELITSSLENQPKDIRLLNVRSYEKENNTYETKALVYVPKGQESYFLNKISDYATKETIKGNPKNANLINSIEDVKIAMLESFWPLTERQFIPASDKTWCEAWLRIDEDEDYENQVTTFIDILEILGIDYKEQSLHFPERSIILIRADINQLSELIMESDQLAEFRIGQEAASFWLQESNIEQIQWVEDLLQRLRIENTDVKVCILDSGVNNGHMLLNPILSDDDCLSVDSTWGVDDRSDITGNRGHGTLMAGIVGYGNLQKELESNGTTLVTHQLCSVKILPRRGESDKENWGAFTEQAIYRAETQSPDKVLLYCMAVTSSSDVDRGRPSSWSGTIDRMSFGENSDKRLMIISGGNVSESYWQNYPESNMIFSVQNPAQAWNALTIGAYTEKTQIGDQRYNVFPRIASLGEISPYNSSSFVWENKWPIKPEVLFEGGNLIDMSDFISSHDDLDILTTSKNFQNFQFDTLNGTSAATAQASWLAAKIAYKYPNIWPETIRALIVHSASWTEQMIHQFGNDDVLKLLRTCGYGVPNTERALSSFENGLTFVAQEYIQPYIKERNQERGSSDYRTNEMHFFELPWPKDLLLSLGETPVILKITLSYFIEPSPGEIGWKDKYRYQSYGLRFDVNRVSENEEQFKKRINKQARDEDEIIDNASNRQDWRIGAKKRSLGSIHSDFWEGNATDIADCNLISVFPVIGWWRERHNLKKYDERARYSLIVSLETPVENIELYSTIQTIMQAVPIEITTTN